MALIGWMVLVPNQQRSAAPQRRIMISAVQRINHLVGQAGEEATRWAMPPSRVVSWWWREQALWDAWGQRTAVPEAIEWQLMTWHPRKWYPLTGEMLAWMQQTVLSQLERAIRQAVDGWIRLSMVGGGTMTDAAIEWLYTVRRLQWDGVEGIELHGLRTVVDGTPEHRDEWLEVYAVPAGEPVRHRHCVGGYSLEPLDQGRYGIGEWQETPWIIVPEALTEELRRFPVNWLDPRDERGEEEQEAAGQWDSDQPVVPEPAQCSEEFAQWIRATLWYPRWRERQSAGPG